MMVLLAWGSKVSPEFRRKVIVICKTLGFDPSWLMACMAFETGGTFSPSVLNKWSRAVGLIQFMPKTAASLGTSSQQLARMSAEAQLDFVYRYFQPWKGRLKSLEDVYMTILWPLAVGKENSFVLFAAPSRQYMQNKGLDIDGGGQVTKWEAAEHVRRRYTRGLDPPLVWEGEIEEV